VRSAILSSSKVESKHRRPPGIPVSLSALLPYLIPKGQHSTITTSSLPSIIIIISDITTIIDHHYHHLLSLQFYHLPLLLYHLLTNTIIIIITTIPFPFLFSSLLSLFIFLSLGCSAFSLSAYLLLTLLLPPLFYFHLPFCLFWTK
jgi:hypothetical protein